MVSWKNLRSDSDTGPAEHCAGGSILISWYSWKSKNCTVNLYPGAYSEPSENSKMERFAEIIND